MAAQFGASPAVNTWILGIYSACQLLAAPLWGRLSDRFGRRPILLSSMIGACASYVMLAFAHSVAALFVARALAGFMAGNFPPRWPMRPISASRPIAPDHGRRGSGHRHRIHARAGIGGVLAGEQLQSATFLRPALVSGRGERTGDAAGAVSCCREPHGGTSACARRRGCSPGTALQCCGCCRHCAG